MVLAKPCRTDLPTRPRSAAQITNSILSEVQRRGVSRDQLLVTLQQLGAEMPLASTELLRMMHGAGVDVWCVARRARGGAGLCACR